MPRNTPEMRMTLKNNAAPDGFFSVARRIFCMPVNSFVWPGRGLFFLPVIIRCLFLFLFLFLFLSVLLLFPVCFC